MIERKSYRVERQNEDGNWCNAVGFGSQNSAEEYAVRMAERGLSDWRVIEITERTLRVFDGRATQEARPMTHISGPAALLLVRRGCPRVRFSPKPRAAAGVSRWRRVLGWLWRVKQ